MKIGFVLIILTVIVAVSSIPKMTFPWSKVASTESSNQQVSYQELYYTQKLSHFNYRMGGRIWRQRYLIDESNWSKDTKGPILMYMGNQGPIEMFYRNAGWYNDVVSKKLNGLLVYPEHRYFGKSWPFGDQQESTKPENLAFLSTEQAMMDYVEFIKFIKQTYCQDCSVVVFGGSYAGMLAAWMRMKYPHVVDIAHAASAPIYYYRNRQNFDIGIFYKIVTKNYEMHSTNCPNVIREAFRRLTSYSQTPMAPISFLSQYFNTCTPIKKYQDIALLMDYINVAYSYLAMINYPYPTSFLKNVTAWPANSSCIPLDKVTPNSNDEILFSAIKESITYYYNFNNKTACNQIYGDSSADEDMSGWDILACGDQVMPMSTDGKQDMFWKADFDYDAYSQQCHNTFQIKPDYDYILNHFGGVTDQEYLSASRIFFTNGGLDPWSGASPNTSLSSSLKACLIPNGAHHLDLRPPNQLDPVDVVKCREEVLSSLTGWLQQINEERSMKVQQKAFISNLMSHIESQ